MGGTLNIKWEYEDELECDITDGMHKASIVDGVRIYPYVQVDGNKYYLEQ